MKKRKKRNQIPFRLTGTNKTMHEYVKIDARSSLPSNLEASDGTAWSKVETGNGGLRMVIHQSRPPIYAPCCVLL